jgi:transcriptional regulator with XRE-family HTH domain
MLSQGRVPDTTGFPTLSRVSKRWPYEEFGVYLRALMDNQGIENYAELSRLTQVSQNQFSNWRRGLAQPSRENLRKIAPVLGLNSPVMLYVAAGLEDHEDLQMDGTPDFTVLPRVFQDLRELYEEMAAAGRGDEVIRSVSVLVSGLRAEFKSETQQTQPSGRARRAS